MQKRNLKQATNQQIAVKNRNSSLEVLSIICKLLNVEDKEIKNMIALKKGMTNRSFLFDYKKKKYIIRIPGKGTEQLINRIEEAAVYKAIEGKGICDHIIYINPHNGYKISEYISNAEVCNPLELEDIKKCMKKLREFHRMKLLVKHEFDIFKQIEFYESLWGGKESVYQDYKKTKGRVFSLKPFIDAYTGKKVLSHIDAIPDNFLISKKNGIESIQMIDWEYAGMHDPHIDIAMFCIYSLYDRNWVDTLIQTYFTEGCSQQIKIKIYCYIAACGLLWSNWCEYKREFGVEFGEYAVQQYNYAKEYSVIIQEELAKIEE